MVDDKLLTISYRDKMRIERMRILNNYAKQTSDKGTMYFVYSKDSTYNLCLCEEGSSHEVIELKEEEIPVGAEVNSVLRENDGIYIFDETSTKEVYELVTNKFNELLEEQSQELKQYRIEGHLYEVSENPGDRLWLIDLTKDDGECFEEVDISREILSEAAEGSVLQYVNGKYIWRLDKSK